MCASGSLTWTGSWTIIAQLGTLGVRGPYGPYVSQVCVHNRRRRAPSTRLAARTAAAAIDHETRAHHLHVCTRTHAHATPTPNDRRAYQSLGGWGTIEQRNAKRIFFGTSKYGNHSLENIIRSHVIASKKPNIHTATRMHTCTHARPFTFARCNVRRTTTPVRLSGSRG